MDDPKALRRYRANLQGEVDGAAIYAALAKAEADPKLAEIYRRLAAVERAHGEFWRKQPGRPAARSTSLSRACAPSCSHGWRGVLDRLSFFRPLQPARSAIAALMTASPRRCRRASPPTSVRMRGSWRLWRARVAALPARRWPGSKAATVAAATRCVPPCSARMTALCPIPAWSWVSPGQR